MNSVPSRSPISTLLLLLVVVAAAAGTRAWYLVVCTGNAQGPAPLLAQDPSPTIAVTERPDSQPETAFNYLVANIREERWFGGFAPLADKEEKTAHVAPAYPFLIAQAGNLGDDSVPIVRWTECVLGALTAGFYFLFARRAFDSIAAALLAGLLCAVHPFWIINTAEIADGVLATFLLGLALLCGTRAAQVSGIFSSLLYGLALAGLSLTRAALLPFAVVALLWFLLRCRSLKRGWMCALLAFLGFANGVAPWAIRNYRTYEDVVPIADSMWLHLWIGNNAKATGGAQTEETLRNSLSPERLQKLRAAPSQDRRYKMLAEDVVQSIKDDPEGTLRRRLSAAQYFMVGQAWYGINTPGWTSSTSEELPEWLDESYPAIVQGTLLVLIFLGLLGWRWSHAWRQQSRLATLAALWVPLPYVLGHAGWLWGPRLPLDGVLLCFAAFALVAFLPRARTIAER